MYTHNNFFTKYGFWLIMQTKHNLNEDLNLRSGQEKDSKFIYLVKKKTLKSYIEQTWGSWDEKFQVSRHNENFISEEYQIIQCKGKDIGVQKIQEEIDSIEIDIIEILPEFQNKGIGTQLLKNIISFSRQNNKIVSLQVLKANTRALKLYKYLGFHVINENDTHLKMKLLKVS